MWSSFALVAALASAALLFAPCDGCDDKTGEYVGTISMAAISGIVLIPFAAIAVARGVHRRPLRAAHAELGWTGSGLQIAF